MEILNFFTCKDLMESKTKEQEYFVALQATLNSVEPMGNKKINKHNKICKSIKETDLDIKTVFNQINDEKSFSCEKCNFKCIKKSEWLRHIITRKHTHLHTIVVEHIKKHSCTHCHKSYKSREGLWYHLKKCNNIDKQQIDSDKNTINFLNSIVLELVKKNTALEKQIIEIINK